MGLTGAPVAILGMPQDRFISHGPRAGQLAECGIDATAIAATVQRFLSNENRGRGDHATELLRPTLASR
jgi:hypothetical protein